MNGALYQAGRGGSATSLFHDPTTGDNSYEIRDENGDLIRTVEGYRAGPGWDAVTGLGSPKVDALVPSLAARR